MQESDLSRAAYMERLKEECGNSLREEVYHESDGSESAGAQHSVCIRKVLEYGSPAVFEYLRTHENPHIPRVIRWQRDPADPGRLIVDEEYIRGITLARALSSAPAPDSQKKREWLMQLLDGLDFLHRARPKIIHRDVKSDNIMIDEEGVLKLIDYDAAKVWHPDETRDTVLLGTDGSAAPEQYGFGQSDQRTDIFAVGRLMQEMFPEDPDLLRVARRACRMDPEDRYQSVPSLRRAVLAAEGCRGAGSGERGGKARVLSSGEEEKDPLGRFSLPPLPGFRTGVRWKKITAVLGYGLIALVTISMKDDRLSAADNLKFAIAALVWQLMTVDVLFTWGPAARRLPGVFAENLFLKISLRILWSLAAFGLIVLFYAVFVPLPGVS
ncbi:serine/threonine protein kinase [Eubacterium pyruvativorans]|uniref:serine/threonine protein kinase n=1 Tax=Eubacterium pyruvativorans TaxID=155865 RepID=UPI001563B6D8|nr:protein kinase [Eubacterium pyruvativorans]